ncbi:HupE/UreJ family protein [Rubritalea tangerina]|uniref:HupE/UreJ family protein n=2 Tax=Rubritalea tangerina TaxID=430798 RepID=A0ABW4ZAL8_9BACT
MKLYRFIVLIFLITSSGVLAHEMRPAYLEIQEITDGQYDVLWKVPAKGMDQRLSLNLRFSDGVETLSEPVSGFVGGAHIQRMQVSKSGGLAGASIYIDGLERTLTDVLCRVEYANGTSLTHRLTPENSSYLIPEEPTIGEVIWTYLVLGVEHILLGIDHLLFVLALLLVVRSWKLLIGTITAFTLAHSITLGLASLGFVSVPGAPVEAIIALSIVFVAAEILRSYQGKPGLTERAPWVVAFSFGLLHGFGFAGALSEIGLPQSAIPMALLSFNIGVELGQLAFVAVLVGGYHLVRRLPLRMPDWSRYVAPYAIGSVAAFWVLERVVAFWP